MSPPIDPTLAASAVGALAMTPASMAKELSDAREKLARGMKKLAEISEENLAIATVPRDEVYREDMVTMYRCKPQVDKLHKFPIIITYALVGRFQMIDLGCRFSADCPIYRPVRTARCGPRI